MGKKIISIEERGGPFQSIFQRVMQMVPSKDRNDIKLQRLIAFRLHIDGEGGTREFLIRKIRRIISSGYQGAMYDFLKGDPATDVTDWTPR